MSPATLDCELYEQTYIADDTHDPLMENYWPGTSFVKDRAWSHLEPALGPDECYQLYPQGYSPKAYDPVAHGFGEPLSKPQRPRLLQHGMNQSRQPNWPTHYPYRQHSPVSGISLSSIESGSPMHAMSPELATAAFPNMLNDSALYASPAPTPDHTLFNNGTAPPAMATGMGGYYPSMLASSDAFPMNQYLLHTTDVQEDSIVGGSDLFDPKAHYPKELELDLDPDLEQDQDQNDNITDSGVGQSISNGYDDDDDAAADTDMDDLDNNAAEDDAEDGTYEPTPDSASAPRLTNHRPTPTRGPRSHARGPSVAGANSRVHKPTTTPTHTRTPSKTKRNTQIKPKPNPNRPTTTTTRNTGPKTKTPLSCPFHHFGCAAVFPSKNEWKRHTLSQHLRLGYYRCDLGSCAIDHPSNITATRGFNDFNRKDLFTQHCRRMHKPEGWGKREYGEVGARERRRFDEEMEGARGRCWVRWREGLESVGCGFCDAVFDAAAEGEGVGEGKDVWEARMEHVARHFEREGRGRMEERVDQGLLDWVVRNEVVKVGEDGGWWLSELLGSDGEVQLGTEEGHYGVRRKSKAMKVVGNVPGREEKRRSGRFRGQNRRSYARVGDLDEGESEDGGADQQTRDEQEEDLVVVIIAPKEAAQQAVVANGDADTDAEADTDTDAPGEED